MPTLVTPETPNLDDLPRNLTTIEFARNHRTRATSVRDRVVLTGSFWGVRPLKLASGRLLWPDVRVVAGDQQ